MDTLKMLEYYKKKEEFQKQFDKLEVEMCKCFREHDMERLKEVTEEYRESTKEYKKLDIE